MTFQFIVLAGLYFMPLIVSFIRRVPNRGSVAVINVFLGWSVIGWVVALAMAARSVPKAHQVIAAQRVVAQPRHSQPNLLEELGDL